MINAFHSSVLVGIVFATGIIIDEKSLIPIGTAIAACGTFYWVGRKLQAIDDKFKASSSRLGRIEVILDELPCAMKCSVKTKEEDAND